MSATSTTAPETASGARQSSGRPEGLLRIVTLVSVVVAAAPPTLQHLAPGLPSPLTTTVSLASIAVGVSAGVLEFVITGRTARGGTSVAVPEQRGPGAPPPARPRRATVSSFWLGAGLFLAALTLVTPLFGPFAVIAGLIAFRRRALAAGVTAVVVVLGLLVALLVVLSATDTTIPADGRTIAGTGSGPTGPPGQQAQVPLHEEQELLTSYFVDLQRRCWYGLVADPAVCAGAAGPVQVQNDLLTYYGYYACRAAGGAPDTCLLRLP